MRLETLAVSKLMERMVNNGASLEELKKVADYMVTAAVYDEMTVNLYDVAEKNGIKELVKKYPPRFSWLGSSDTSAKELLNLKYGVQKQEYNLSSIKVGDKITVDLKELGKFEATVPFFKMLIVSAQASLECIITGLLTSTAICNCLSNHLSCTALSGSS